MTDRAQFCAVLPASPRHLATLRRFLAHTLVLCDSGANEGEAALVLSELATNALEYGDSEVLNLRLRVTADHLTIELCDRSLAPPSIVEAPAGHSTGRGLRIVDQLARDWGWQVRDGSRKVVWATLDAEPAPGR